MKVERVSPTLALLFLPPRRDSRPFSRTFFPPFPVIQLCTFFLDTWFIAAFPVNKKEVPGRLPCAHPHRLASRGLTLETVSLSFLHWGFQVLRYELFHMTAAPSLSPRLVFRIVLYEDVERINSPFRPGHGSLLPRTRQHRVSA